MIKLNPFYLLLFFYLFVNFIFAIIGFNSNLVEIEMSNFNLKSNSFLVAFFFQFLFCNLIFFIYFLFRNKGKKEKLEIGSKWSLILFLFQLCFLFYNTYYGTNVAGASIEASNPLLNIFFVLLPVDLFYLLFSPYLKSNRWFLANSLIYIISNTLRGWMGVILLVFFVYLCRKKEVFLNVKNLIVSAVFILITILLLPYLFFLKWAMRTNESVISAIYNVQNNGYIEILSESMYYVFNRFQHNYHVALIWENSEKLILYSQYGKLLPYWGEGVLQTIFLKIMHLDNMNTLGQAMVTQLFFSQDSWNSNPGLAGWLIISQEFFPLYILYIVSLLSLGFYFSIKLYGNKMFMLISVFSVFYLFHGWIGMFFNMIFYLVIFGLIRRLSLSLK